MPELRTTNSPNPVTPRLLRVYDAARELQLTEAALRAMIHRGQLPTGVVVRLGRRIRIDVNSLYHSMHNLTVSSPTRGRQEGRR